MAIVIIFMVHLSAIKETISGAINNVNGRLQRQVPANIAQLRINYEDAAVLKHYILY